jgi:hypothetical protein
MRFRGIVTCRLKQQMTEDLDKSIVHLGWKPW